MIIGSKKAFVELELEEDQFFPDPSYRVRMFRDGFAGETEGIWISRDDAKKFIEQLRQLEKDELEVVELLNLSSESEESPLTFKIRKVDAIGHLTIEAAVRRWIISAGNGELLLTSIRFEFDREYFSSLIRDFTELFQG